LSLPVAKFSEDERTLILTDGSKSWKLPRPVISDWKYKPKGKVYWVAPDGNDQNGGTETRPFKTVGRAIEKAMAGDLVYAKAGTYKEVLTLTKSGQDGKPIIISCAPGALGKVFLTSPKAYVEKNPGGAVVTLKGAKYVWVNGFVIVGPKGLPYAPKMETYGANGITLLGNAGQGCRATNNVVCRNVHCGMKEMHHGGTKFLIEGNIVFDNGTESRDHGIYVPSDDAVINGNIIFNNAGYGIHAYEKPTKLTITRNVCFGNTTGGIIIAGSDCKILNNVCASNGRGIFYFRKDCRNNIVKNNIFASNKTDCDYDNGGGKLGDPADNSVDYNCCFPGKPHPKVKPGEHELLKDPKFVDPKKGDFRLKPGSPCIGVGTDVGLPYDGKKPNVGAY
jgi:parallel beta-helix repeat protein